MPDDAGDAIGPSVRLRCTRQTGLALLTTTGLGSVVAPLLAAAGTRKRKKGTPKPAAPPPPCPAPPAAAAVHVQPPFTIEQHHAAFIATVDCGATRFVPNAPGVPVPQPWVDATCASDDTRDGVQDPFLFVSRNDPSGDDRNPTIRHLLPGRYEDVDSLEAQATNATAVLVLLRAASDTVVQWWGNPANAQNGPGVWHVVALEGATGLVGTSNPSRAVRFDAAHLPEPDVCPSKFCGAPSPSQKRPPQRLSL